MAERPRFAFFRINAGPLQAVAGAVSLVVRRDPLPPRPLVAVAVALAAGAAAGLCPLRAAGISLALPCWLAAAAAVAAWGLARRWRRERLAGALVLVVAFLAGAAWAAARFDLFATDDLAWQLDAAPVPVAVQGKVVASPRQLAPADDDPRRAAAIGPVSECVVRVEAIRDGDCWRPAGGLAAVIARGKPRELVAGSRVRMFGRGLRPSGGANPGEFDFGQRARAARCLSIVRLDSWDGVHVLAEPSPWSLVAAIDRLRSRAADVLAAGIAPERAPLAAALLVGQRGSLPPASVDAFVVTGTIHVLAISGLHVGLLAAGLFAAFRGLLVPRGWAVTAVAVVTGLYALLVGAETPVVRATFQVWAACLAALVARRPATINAMAGAVIVVVAWRPADVLAAGAQLSFLSTAMLVGVASVLAAPRQTDPIARLVERSRAPWERWLRRAGRQTGALAVSGLAIWLATAPLVAMRFNVVSPVAVVANLLIAPLVPVAMACGFLCLLSAPLSTGLCRLFAVGCDASLAMIGGIVERAAAVPAGHFWVAGPPGWWTLGWYVLLAVAIVSLRPDLPRRASTWAFLSGAWAVVGLVAWGIDAAVPPARPGARVVVAAVGHGCGILVKGPTGRCLLYDAGRMGSGAAARRAVSGVLWSEGIGRVDSLVISHADADHFNAVPGLLGRFSVGEILVAEAFLASDAPGVATVLSAAAARGVPVRTLRAGDSFAIDPLCRVRVLHPAGGPEGRAPGVPGQRGSDNEASLVLSVETAGRRLLLTGDLEGDALAAFTASAPGACDVLMAPHHGSPASLPVDVVRATRPAVVLVSGRDGRGWPLVRDACATGVGGEPALVLGTGSHGALAVTLAAGGLSVERFAAGCWRPADPADDQAAAAGGGRIMSQPAASSSTWLATYVANSSSTPLVKP